MLQAPPHLDRAGQGRQSHCDYVPTLLVGERNCTATALALPGVSEVMLWLVLG